MGASSISLPTVRITSLGGMDPNCPSFSQSGVAIAFVKSIGVGRSTFISCDSSILTKLSSCIFAFSIASFERGP